MMILLISPKRYNNFHFFTIFTVNIRIYYNIMKYLLLNKVNYYNYIILNKLKKLRQINTVVLLWNFALKWIVKRR